MALPHHPSSRFRLSQLRLFRTLTMLSTVVLVFSSLATQTRAESSSGTEGLIPATDLAKLIPATVFFRGQVATVQARNAAGVSMPGGMLVLSALVDTSGYSTGVQEKYQAYFITEIALDVDGHTLQPGAYGVGFVQGKFLVMDLGAHDLFTAASTHDTGLKRPSPLQMTADSAPGHWRLYVNRNYVMFSQAGGR